MKVSVRSMWILGACLWVASPGRADESSRVKISNQGKAATALVEINLQYASAFCVHPSGMFVTNEHVVRAAGEGGAVTMVLDPGLATQKVLKGKVIRADQDLDLALLRVEGAKDLPVLSLGSADNLVELMELVAFGFPFGKDLAPTKEEYPAISVNVGTVTSLRRKGKELYHIQLDAALNPGNSGGPVLNKDGTVVGVVVAGVRGSGVNFAIPVNQVRSFMARPDLKFTAPQLTAANLHQPVLFQVRATPLLPTDGPFRIDLILQAGEEKERSFKMELVEGAYQVSAVPVPASQGPPPLRLSATFATGMLTGSIPDRTLQIGGEAVHLRDVRRLQFQPRVQANLHNGRVLQGNLSGLDGLSVQVGPESLRVDLTKAMEARVEPPATIEAVTYRIVVSQNGQEIDRLSESMTIPHRDGATGGRGLAVAATAIVPPLLTEDKTIRTLPAPIEDLAVGGGGRYLILHLPKVRKLAIFDVNLARVVHLIAIAEDHIKFAAGMDKLIVVLPGQNLIQRWNLHSFEREVTTTLPVKGVVRSLCMGAASTGPLVVYASGDSRTSYGGQLHFLNIHSLKPIEVGWTNQRPQLGYENTHIRASADGKVFGLWSPQVSPQGFHSLVMVGNAIRAYNQHTTVYHIVPGPEGKVLFTGTGLYTNDLKHLGEGQREQRRYLPAHGEGNYYLAFQPAATKSTLSIYMMGEARPIATLPDIDVGIGNGREEFSRDFLALDKRIHFLPAANLIITVPAAKDHVVLHRLNVTEALEKSDIDYLFVASQPPLSVKKGALYAYQLEVKSKKQGLKYQVEAGPPGMTISNAGKLTWKVPADFAETESDVIVSVRNPMGQDCFHTFKITVQE